MRKNVTYRCVDSKASGGPLRIGRRHTGVVGRRGAAAVEFAIVLPLFLTIVLGCIDFGRFAYSYIAVANAARAGAGTGMMQRVTAATAANWQSLVQQAVTEEMEQVMISDAADPADLQVSATHVVETSGLSRVSVVVVYPFETVVPWPLIPDSIQLRQSVVMRVIR
jgi:Flp pilus assembly protein TadG